MMLVVNGTQIKINSIVTFCREALAAVCQRRGVDLSNVNVYLDSSKTPLSLITTETFWLGGKHLRIKGSYFLHQDFACLSFYSQNYYK